MDPNVFAWIFPSGSVYNFMDAINSSGNSHFKLPVYPVPRSLVLKDFGKGGYAEVNKTPRSNKRKRVTEDLPAGKNKTLITLNLEGIPTRYITHLRRALIAAAKENILVGDNNEDLLEDNW
ncbi:hypothetical protein SODALDRAFT_321375 [Sodiomyces alkalinus F11]|uniref:Uncharacterized protein n=1 Tax=Sodiomyces alkalinus (strain CBS 110278 / VKM F-3762 / F11) TaxID=1314773 RepID=A0A3N2PJK9_SODAK|nr:hypothetical protein SODALDRAFT_321375 [Sodiomyces alkalinus F11]ROT34707.1 hypothetical protein SODALDRAFT_321375 [Sodiomyces alkalinus F11]